MPVQPPAPKPPPVQPPPVEPPPPAEPPPAEPADAYYKNCDAARAAGAAPLHRGEPGYRAGLDRDGDGTACEAT
ncbi:excalibur calcium-binding domain-containing protein [Actinophytocola algeriensis]|uniref:excalibur calcium-binding domain-containing protein n=1 Tax=Actinophytocola algeriensis TaxID=1768010 RepID=UPI0028936A20|nr:excalibur calcium-binding domain-containing protein [Actinophytocola algeriensis]